MLSEYETKMLMKRIAAQSQHTHTYKYMYIHTYIYIFMHYQLNSALNKLKTNKTNPLERSLLNLRFVLYSKISIL